MDAIIAQRLLAIKSHPKYFLKYATFTKDGNDLINPCKQFPYELEYHQQICEGYTDEAGNIIPGWADSKLFVILKSRQMQVTWHFLASHLWLALTGPDREIYFRRQTFDDALKLLEDTEYIYNRIPEDVWPRKLLPKMEPREGELWFPEINTGIFAVSSGRDKMRGRTPTAVLLDEYQVQEDDAMVYQTLKPAFNGGAKITAIGTAKPLFGGDDPYLRKLIEDRA